LSFGDGGDERFGGQGRERERFASYGSAGGFRQGQGGGYGKGGAQIIAEEADE